MDNQCGFWRCANRLGLFLVILFTLCFLWIFIHPVETELHLKSLRLAFFGFTDLNLGSFVLGAVQSYLWAYVGLGIWRVVGCCFNKSGSCEK